MGNIFAASHPASLFSRSPCGYLRAYAIQKAHHVFLLAELYSYLRSPYRDLSAYDNNVQVGLLRLGWSVLALV